MVNASPDSESRDALREPEFAVQPHIHLAHSRTGIQIARQPRRAPSGAVPESFPAPPVRQLFRLRPRDHRRYLGLLRVHDRGVRDWPTWTIRPVCTVFANPALVTGISYARGCRNWATNMPASLLESVRSTWVAVFLTSTAAQGITAPLGSVTVPVMVPAPVFGRMVLPEGWRRRPQNEF